MYLKIKQGIIKARVQSEVRGEAYVSNGKASLKIFD